MQKIRLSVMEFGRFTEVAQRPECPAKLLGQYRLQPLCTRSFPGGRLQKPPPSIVGSFCTALRSLSDIR